MSVPARNHSGSRPRAAPKAREAYHHGDLRNAAVAEAVRLIGQTRDTDFTLRDLAARLRVSSTALYRHFPSKLALLAAVAEEGFRELVEACARHEMLLETDPVAGLREQGLEYVRFALGNPGHFRVMFSPELARAKEQFPSLREAGQASYQQLKGTLTVCQARGLLNDFDLDAIALTAWSTVHGIATLLLDGLVKLDESGSASEEQILGVAQQVIRIMRYGALRSVPGAKEAGKG